jgi:hypothetical protein
MQIDARDGNLTVAGNIASSQRAPGCAGARRGRPGPLVWHDDVSADDPWAMAPRLRSLVRALLQGWELSRCGGSATIVGRVGRRSIISDVPHAARAPAGAARGHAPRPCLTTPSDDLQPARTRRLLAVSEGWGSAAAPMDNL